MDKKDNSLGQGTAAVAGGWWTIDVMDTNLVARAGIAQAGVTGNLDRHRV